MNFPRQELADEYRRQCVDVHLDLIPGYDPAQLLWAISGNESSFGANCKPRYEPAYDHGGKYGANPDMLPLLAKFGKAAACSYGPGQVLLVNAPKGYAPFDFNELPKAVAAQIFALNALLVRHKPNSLAQIGACYNGGHVPKGIWPPAIHDYANKLIVNYGEPMPEEVLKG